MDVKSGSTLTLVGTRAVQGLQALYRQIAVLDSSRNFKQIMTFDLVDNMVTISDDQFQHCFREYGRYCLKEGTINCLEEEYRVRSVLLSVTYLLDPDFSTRSSAIKRLGNVLWDVSLDAIEYAYAIRSTSSALLSQR